MKRLRTGRTGRIKRVGMDKVYQEYPINGSMSRGVGKYLVQSKDVGWMAWKRQSTGERQVTGGIDDQRQ
jgi:hypothetical protein